MSRIFSIQSFLLFATLSSWGILFMCVSYFGLRTQRFTKSYHDQWTFAQTQKSPNFKISEDSCSKCLPLNRSLRELLSPIVNKDDGVTFTPNTEYVKDLNMNSEALKRTLKSGDVFHLLSLKSVLTTMKVRLKSIEKIDGVKKDEIKTIQCKVEHLERKIESFLQNVNKNDSSTNILKKSTLESSDRWREYDDETFYESNHVIPVNKRVSIILDGRNKDLNLLLKSKYNVVPNVEIHVGVSNPEFYKIEWGFDGLVHFHVIPNNFSAGLSHLTLLKYVKTPYTFVATELFYFDESINFDKLLYMIKNTHVWAVGGGILNSNNEWSNGCYQTIYKNFLMRMYRKNYAFINGCVVCSVLESPFLASTSLLQSISWNINLSWTSSIIDLFLKASYHSYFTSVSCLDSVIPSRNIYKYLPKEDVVQLAAEHRLMTIQLPDLNPVEMKCDQIPDVCRKKGEILSPCCRSELTAMIAFFFSTCEKFHIICELQEGTLLGAVKFNNILPWEKDADITFHTANFSTLRSLSSRFTKAGYTLKMTDNRWCCIDGKEAGGKGILTSEHWVVELYSQHAMDTEDLMLQGLKPTLINLAGTWIGAPKNPANYTRNRYGNALYQHSEHWLDIGLPNGWTKYKSASSFSLCYESGHHSCLLSQVTDGNIQFNVPCN